MRSNRIEIDRQDGASLYIIRPKEKRLYLRRNIRRGQERLGTGRVMMGYSLRCASILLCNERASGKDRLLRR